MLYNTVKDFQSGIVGILGFTGVIITLFVNAHLAQLTRDEQIKQSRVVLQTALQQELTSIKEELVNINEGVKKGGTQPVGFTLEEPYVYRTLVKDIGVLEPEQTKEVIRVYRDLYLIMNALRGLSTDSSKPVVMMEPKNFPAAAKLIARVLDETDGGIQALAH